MKEIMLAIDVGTTNAKCIAFGVGMQVLGEGASEYETLATGGNGYEQRPEDWWIHTKAAMAKALKRAGCSASQVVQIAVSAQAPTLLCLDGAGKPLRNAMIWMDRRSDSQCAWIERALPGKRVYQITGNSVDPYYPLSGLLWVRENEPWVYEKTRCLLQINGYINYKLTGELSIDEPHATVTQAWDIRGGCWSDEIIEALDLDRAWLPRVQRVFDTVGRVSREASEETGLPLGCQVLAGCPDASAAAFEAGVSASGVAAEMSGTSSVLMLATERIHTAECMTYIKSAIPDQHMLLGTMSTNGASLKWFRDTLYRDTGDGGNAYARMNDEIARDCPGPSRLLFLPYLAGERAPIWDTMARGAFYGITLGTTRAEMMRAVMEGGALAFFDTCLGARAAGVRIKKLRAVGGTTNSRIWMQIKASLLDMPIEIPRTNLGAPGGMMAIMAYARGEYGSIEEASEALVEIGQVVEPVPVWTNFYRDRYQLYKKLYETTRCINMGLAGEKYP